MKLPVHFINISQFYVFVHPFSCDLFTCDYLQTKNYSSIESIVDRLHDFVYP